MTGKSANERTASVGSTKPASFGMFQDASCSPSIVDKIACWAVVTDFASRQSGSGARGP